MYSAATSVEQVCLPFSSGWGYKFVTWSSGHWWSCPYTSLASPPCPLLSTPALFIFCQFFQKFLADFSAINSPASPTPKHLTLLPVNMNLLFSSCSDNILDNPSWTPLPGSLEIHFLKTSFLSLKAPSAVCDYTFNRDTFINTHETTRLSKFF